MKRKTVKPMKGNDTISCMQEALLRHEKICIAGHSNPDGDAIGACLALGLSLQKAGKKVTVLLEDFAKKYDILEGKELIGEPKEAPELFVVLDCGGVDRLPAFARQWMEQARLTLQVDHHTSNPYFAHFNLVEEDASSTSEIVYTILRNEFPIDRRIALDLYAGLIYDTSAFHHTCTAPSTLRIAGELVSYGFDFTAVYDRFFYEKSFGETKALAKGIDHAERYFDNKCVLSTLTAQEIKDCGCTSKELDGIIAALNNIQQIEVACFLYERESGEIKGSFRGKGDWDVCVLAQQFGGGGHVKAAGCTFQCSLEEAKKQVLDAIGAVVHAKSELH